ncbi:hypothetical protein M0804_004086 [Polistes exclamans]|nr:hypothetical protein M0804_004086 [Polistes exclamans]
MTIDVVVDDYYYDYDDYDDDDDDDDDEDDALGFSTDRLNTEGSTSTFRIVYYDRSNDLGIVSSETKTITNNYPPFILLHFVYFPLID